jgi:hypothetical protein
VTGDRRRRAVAELRATWRRSRSCARAHGRSYFDTGKTTSTTTGGDPWPSPSSTPAQALRELLRNQRVEIRRGRRPLRPRRRRRPQRPRTARPGAPTSSARSGGRHGRRPVRAARPTSAPGPRRRSPTARRPSSCPATPTGGQIWRGYYLASPASRVASGMRYGRTRSAATTLHVAAGAGYWGRTPPRCGSARRDELTRVILRAPAARVTRQRTRRWLAERVAGVRPVGERCLAFIHHGGERRTADRREGSRPHARSTGEAAWIPTSLNDVRHRPYAECLPTRWRPSSRRRG